MTLRRSMHSGERTRLRRVAERRARAVQLHAHHGARRERCAPERRQQQCALRRAVGCCQAR